MKRCLPVVALLGVLVLAACGGGEDASSPASPSGASDTSSSASTAPAGDGTELEEGVPSGLRSVLGDDVSGLPTPAIDLDEIRPGGPPPDGIPPIDNPTFLSAGEVDFLADNEPVLALRIDGEARAYPVQILIWHEIVNDTVGGVPVSVTYCPLCNSAIAYDRRVGDRVLSFGTSGMLWNSALVMYDRQTETLWSHFTGGGIHGILTGTDLEVVPVATVPWSLWRDANPEGLVLDRDTGFDRPYGRNPYPGYDDAGSFPFLFEGTVDGRYTAMTRVVGLERDGSSLAVPLAELEERRVVHTELAGDDVVVWWAPGTASALDTREIAEGNDVGATGAFLPTVDDRRLSFSADDDGSFVDAETGSTWNLLGQATDGPLAGRQLEPTPHTDTFWFAWSTFLPDTVVVDQ